MSEADPPAPAGSPPRRPSALKVSGKKAQSRRAIIAAFCEVVIERGYARATLLETARRAEVDNNAVFRLFPNKRALVFAYYTEKLHEVRELLLDTEAYHQYPLEERLTAFFETLLVLHRPNREFIELSSAVARYSPLGALNGHLQVKAAAREIFDELIIEATDIDEFADHRLFRHLPALLTEFLHQLFVFWMLDESSGYEQSTKAVYVGVRALLNTLQDRHPLDGISRDSIPQPPVLASAMNMRRLLRSLLLSGVGRDGEEEPT
ncbi:TetR/AcrR family transcriptional regulator [Archangium violaceum]|nr:TetR family transcriptional regulator [Archangium violaceum]